MLLPCLKPSSGFLGTYNRIQTHSGVCRNQPCPFFWPPMYTCSPSSTPLQKLGFFLFPKHTNLRAFAGAVPSPWDTLLSEAGSFLTLGPHLNMTFSETLLWIMILKVASVLVFVVVVVLLLLFYFHKFGFNFYLYSFSSKPNTLIQ